MRVTSEVREARQLKVVIEVALLHSATGLLYGIITQCTITNVDEIFNVESQKYTMETISSLYAESAGV